jgi:hypothetical protein
MPRVTVEMEGVEVELPTPSRVHVDVTVDGKKQHYQLVFHDEGLLLEESLESQSEPLITLVQRLYSEYGQ